VLVRVRVCGGGRLFGGIALAVLLMTAAGGSAAAAPLTPGLACRSGVAIGSGDAPGLAQRARAAEDILSGQLADDARGDRALAALTMENEGGGPGALALASYCLAAGEAMRLARAGSAFQAETYLQASIRFARAADAKDLEARAAYRLALAAMDGPAVSETADPGAPARNLAAASVASPFSSQGCAAAADFPAYSRAGQALVIAALTCARETARKAGDAALGALAGLKLARLQLAASAAQPQAAAALRAAARDTALRTLAEASASDGHGRTELIGRLVETALDAGASASAELDAAGAQMRSAAGNDAESAYALAIAGRLALARGERDRAQGLLGQAVYLESQRGAPLRLATWLLWLGAADPGRRDELVTEAYRALETARPFLPLVDPLTEESTFSLRMQPVFEQAVAVALAADDPAGEATRIASAQAVVEAYRQAEVQSALGADCVPPREAIRPGELRPDEVLLYPILLPDRIELIYARGSANGAAAYRRLSVRGADRAAVARLASLMVASASGETGEAWRQSARQLYQLFIKPIEGELTTTGALIIVPDGVLRAVPFAALVDGQGRFLVERTAVAVAPALSYSQPGADRGHKALDVVAASLEKRIQLPAGDFPKLEGTAAEGQVAVEVGGSGAHSRLIRDFRKADLQAALSDGHVDILHVATHAAFNGRTDRSFIVANGEAISLSDLRGMIATDRVRGDELSLLVLSACETAVGDDQASMGLAGAAVQAGAQSALASLWEVSDEATVELMKGFYTAYHAGSGKAAALRQAQLKMIAAGGGLEQPGLWAAFTMLGGWR
jgi:CHAT domain-containing protein